MKYLAPLLVLFALVEYAAPNGMPVFVSRDQVVAVAEPNGECREEAHARIITTKGDTCVRETVQEVVRKLSLQ